MTLYFEPHESVVDTIGETPLVEVHTGPSSVDVYAKLETFNPGGSVKDRIGKHILETLLDRGEVSPGGTIVEPTAGNTGIGIAVAAGRMGLDSIFVVPEGFSEEKERLMAALGGEIVHTSGEDGMHGAIAKAESIAAEMDNAVVPQQFSNPANVEAHRLTTGPEIIAALDGRIGAVVAGIGSGGTVMGIGRAVLEEVGDAHVVGVEPEGSTFGALFGGDPREDSYKTEGIGTHEPQLAELVDTSVVAEMVSVSDREAHAEVTRLASEEGQLVGSSSGAASVAARRVAERIAEGDLEVPYDTVVTVFPDGSERYLSKNLYGEFEDWEGKK